jgi:hypothetical protein
MSEEEPRLDLGQGEGVLWRFLNYFGHQILERENLLIPVVLVTDRDDPALIIGCRN